MFKRLIKKRLNNYIELVAESSKSASYNLEKEKSVAVIGGGIAGLSSAYHLAKRGFSVDLYEKNSYFGGKLGSWKIKDHLGNELYTEHGFHAFFRQYLNFRKFLTELKIDLSFKALDNYSILLKNREVIDFKGIEKSPVLNILALRKKGLFSVWEILKNPRLIRLMDLLKYHPVKTFERYDHISYKEFIDKYKIPKKLEIVFTSFARAFFASPEEISMAELIKSFHFYFLASDHGLDYDVLDDDFEFTFLKKLRDSLAEYAVEMINHIEVDRISKDGEQFTVSGKKYDYLVLATDAKSASDIIRKSRISPEGLSGEISKLQQKSYYAVLRIWSKQRLDLNGLPFFVFTDRLTVLDSITFYHEMEKSSEEWARENDGAVYELHSYNIDSTIKEDDVRDLLIRDFIHYFPDFDSSTILFDFFQYRNDFSSYGLKLNHIRPGTKTENKGLFLAGDWVRLPIPVMLMEAAYSSALFAVNEIFKNEELDTEEIISVSRKGVFA